MKCVNIKKILDLPDITITTDSIETESTAVKSQLILHSLH